MTLHLDGESRLLDNQTWCHPGRPKVTESLMPWQRSTVTSPWRKGPTMTVAPALPTDYVVALHMKERMKEMKDVDDIAKRFD